MDQTGDAIANEVLLVRDTYNGSVLILEGDNDEKLFRRFVEDSEMPIIPAWGKVRPTIRIKSAVGTTSSRSLALPCERLWEVGKAKKRPLKHWALHYVLRTTAKIFAKPNSTPMQSSGLKGIEATTYSWTGANC